MSQLSDRIQDMFGGRQKWTFSLEAGRGTTYFNNKATLYGHSTYERGSVLAGQDQRVFVDQWENWDEARAALAEVKKTVKRFKYEDFGEQGGTTHAPVNLSHLPDDTDY
jgi:hypothetical protein